jgi:hypothetical protein
MSKPIKPKEENKEKTLIEFELEIRDNFLKLPLEKLDSIITWINEFSNRIHAPLQYSNSKRDQIYFLQRKIATEIKNYRLQNMSREDLLKKIEKTEQALGRSPETIHIKAALQKKISELKYDLAALESYIEKENHKKERQKERENKTD